ncbi:unnamed protein product [Leuciscus chuanchicus]
MSKTRDKNASSSKASLAEQQAHANPAVDGATATVLLQAIESLKTELKQDNTRVRQDITSLQQELSGKLDTMAEDLRGLTDRVEEAESRVGRVEDVTLDLAVALAESMKRQKGLRDKLTDLESRSRRNNIRIFGVDEGEKPTSMAKFVADLLQHDAEIWLQKLNGWQQVGQSSKECASNNSAKGKSRVAPVDGVITLDIKDGGDSYASQPLHRVLSFLEI